MPAAAAGYRPPPPAMSAYYNMQYSSTNEIATPSTFLPRIPSRTSITHYTNSQIPYHSGAPTRASSNASIAALPSLSNSLCDLANATSMEQVALQTTRTVEGEDLLRRLVESNSKRMSGSSAGLQTNQQDNRFVKYDDSSSDSEDDDEDGYRSSRQRSSHFSSSKPLAKSSPAMHNAPSSSQDHSSYFSQSSNGPIQRSNSGLMMSQRSKRSKASFSTQ